MSNNLNGNVAIPSGKLPWKSKFAYAIGGGGEALPFNLFALYFMFVLTDVVGFSPMWAGVISSVGLAWDAFTDPTIGFLSDKNTSPMGRRRSFMAVGFVPLAICLVLLFAPNSLTGGVQIFYYFAIVLLLYLFETMYVVPYYALCTELTTDYSERNNLRTFSMWINYGLLILGTSGPMFILRKTTESGGTEKQAWGYTGIVFAALTILVCLVCVITTRGKGIVLSKKADERIEQPKFFKSLKQLLMLKAYRSIVFMTICWSVTTSIFLSGVTYLLTHVTMLDPSQQSLYWVLYSLFAMALLPLVAWFAGKFGKKEVLTIVVVVLIANAVIFSFVGLSSFPLAIAWTVMCACGVSTFFTYCISLGFEIAEIQEFKHGSRQEGQILSIINFSRKCGAALATFILGAWLTYIKYDATLAAQTAETQKGLVNGLTLIPAIFFAGALIFLLVNPLKKKTYILLLSALEKKRKGEVVSTEEFDTILK